MHTRRILMALCALWTSACATAKHVELQPAPSASDPYAVRAAYYKAHALGLYDGQKIMLHDGTAIYYPEDLKPTVAADSPTAKAIARANEAQTEIDGLNRVQLGLAGVGLGGLVLAVGSASALGVALDPQQPEWMATAALGGLAIGGAAILTGGLAGIVAPTFYAGATQQHTEAIQAIVTTYPQSLSDQVAIQPGDNGALIDTVPGHATTAPQPSQNDL